MLNPYEAPQWTREYMDNMMKKSEPSIALSMKNMQMEQFLSQKNLDKINEMLVNKVYKQSNGKFKIHKQNPVALGTIMRETYEMNDFYNIEEYNKFVSDYATTNIIKNIISHINYKNQITDEVSLSNNNWKNIMDLPQDVKSMKTSETQYNNF